MPLEHGNIDFKHCPIPPRTIRLVQIRLGTTGIIECDLINVPLPRGADDLFEYKAVSYTWGSNEKTSSIEIEGKRLNVTSNLHSLLHDLMVVEGKFEYFWIDAICIDQEDETHEEKSHQVQMMGEIYNQAREVIIYLGRSNDSDNILFSSLMRLDRETRGNYWPPTDEQWDTAWRKVQINLSDWNQNLHQRQLRQLTALTQNPWFRRVWILQEVAKARSATVLYSCQRVSTRIFALAPRLIGIELDPHQQAVFDLMPGPSKRYSWWNGGPDLYILLRKFAHAEATEDRDRIYALLGMCQDGSSNSVLLPNYKQPINEVIASTAAYVYSLSREDLPELPYTTIRSFLASFGASDRIIPLQLLEKGKIETLADFLTMNPTLPITEGFLQRVARDETNNLKSIYAILGQREKKVKITEDVVRDADKSTSGEAMMEYLLQSRPIPGILDAIFGDSRNGRQYIQFLRYPHKFPWIYGRLEFETQLQLFQPPEDWNVLTEDFVELAVNWNGIGNDAIETCLRNRKCVITADATKMLIKVASHSTLALLFERETQIRTRSANIADIRRRGREIMTGLLERNNDLERLRYRELLQAIEDGLDGFAIRKITLREGIDEWDLYGWSPLSWAAALGHREVVQWLVKYGADPEKKDRTGSLPRGWAMANGHIKLVEVIETLILHKYQRALKDKSS